MGSIVIGSGERQNERTRERDINGVKSIDIPGESVLLRKETKEITKLKKNNVQGKPEKEMVKKGRREQHISDSCLQTAAEHRMSPW